MTRILAIEDEASVLENILETLEFEGFEVIGAPNGQAGLQLARQHVPDLIVCDITMPELDGLEVLTELRKDQQTTAIPFIFLTARADRAFMRQGMNLGADDYLTKPFTSAELLAAVYTRLDKQKLAQKVADAGLEEARSKLIQMVSHELRTPLISINMSLEIIAKQIDQLSPHQVEELLEYVSHGSDRLNHVVEQMALMTQLQSGLLTQESVARGGQPIRFSEMLVTTVSLARHFASRRPDAMIRLDQYDSEAVVSGNLKALKHALAELITNALNFSPQGGEVVVTQWEANGYVWLTVTDHGPGIPEDRLKLTLKEFEQLDRQTQEQQGMGLGLPLANRIIEAHGGMLQINSVVGSGTQVTVKLPLVRPE
jgi:signal transduction histidine kinase